MPVDYTKTLKGIGINENPKISPWRLNNPQLPYSSLDPGLLSYMDSLPIDIQKGIVITSSTGGEHAKNSRHSKGRALDIRIQNKENPYEDMFFKYLGADSERRKSLGVVVLNPEHGSAPHIHLSYGTGTENAMDYFYGSNAAQNKPSDIPSLNPPPLSTGVPSNLEDNLQMLEEFKSLLESAKQHQEVEQKNAALTKAKNTLAEKQNEINRKMDFIKDFQLGFEAVNYSV